MFVILALPISAMIGNRSEAFVGKRPAQPRAADGNSRRRQNLRPGVRLDGPMSANRAAEVRGVAARQPSFGRRCAKPAPVVWISVPAMSWCEIILEAGS